MFDIKPENNAYDQQIKSHPNSFLLIWVLISRCYNYWFWVPVVAPLIGSVIGSTMYVIFISLHLPDPDQPETFSTDFHISEKVKQPSPKSDDGGDLKMARF